MHPATIYRTPDGETMDRRNFLKTTGTFIAGATIARSAFANAAAEANASPGTAGSAHEPELALQPHGRGRGARPRF